MVDGPRQLRKIQGSNRSPFNRYAAIAVILVAVGFGIYMTAGRPAPEKTETASLTPIEKSLSRLYDEAKNDLMKKDLKAAASKFQQIANIKPGYKDAEKQVRVITKALDALAAEAPGETTNGGESDSGGTDGGDNNGDNTDGDNSPDGGDSGGTDPGNNDGGDSGGTDPGNNDGADPGDSLKPIPDGATPISLHMDEIDGYIQIAKIWSPEPILAEAVYLPVAREIRTEIDRVIVKIAKFETAALADAALQNDKVEYRLEGEIISINGHKAYTGMNDFSDSELFKLKQIATLSWTRGKWFFSVQVLPSPQGVPSNQYKKGLARDIAIKLGY